jgi:hypothetical protein
VCVCVSTVVRVGPADDECTSLSLSLVEMENAGWSVDVINMNTHKSLLEAVGGGRETRCGAYSFVTLS